MKQAIVTGASRGMGAGICQYLLAQGYRVLGLSRTSCAEGIQHIPVDFASPQQVEAVAKQIVKQLPAIDLIVCAAGIGYFGQLENLSLTGIQQVMDVNYTSHAALLSVLIPKMKQQKAGRVIAIGSESALQGATQGGAYCASKFALRGLLNTRQ